MIHSFADSRRFYLIIAVWVLVCGLSAVDLYDLSDELLQPPTVAGIIVESEIEELDDDVLALLRRETGLPRKGLVAWSDQDWSMLHVSREQRALPPLYLQVSQFRI